MRFKKLDTKAYGTAILSFMLWMPLPVLLVFLTLTEKQHRFIRYVSQNPDCLNPGITVAFYVTWR